MQHTCSACKTVNSHVLDFNIEEFICSHCGALNSKGKTLRKIKQLESGALKIGDRGVLDGNEWFVVAIVHRKYGSTIRWREYYLKDSKGQNSFLSENDGNFVLMYPTESKLDAFDGIYCEFEGKKYRRYETTHCAIEAAVGFFEDDIFFGVAQYLEYVNGKNMVSHEIHGDRLENFTGKHIPRFMVKSAFNVDVMPQKLAVGIVEPYFIDTRQLLNIFSITALLMGLIYFHLTFQRKNQEVLNESISFTEIYGREFISKSFELKGASAPMVVNLHSNVDNSWANAEITLVNESTNEIMYTSQDIEKYSGVSDGERWSEGSTSKNLNLCGIPAGKYHFEIAAQKEGLENSGLPEYFSADGKSVFREESDGWIVVTQDSGETVRHFQSAGFAQAEPELYSQYQEAKKNSDNLTTRPVITDPTPSNSALNIRAAWKPVTMWNIGLLLVIMVVLTVAAFVFKYYFHQKKWSDSGNSPYDY